MSDPQVQKIALQLSLGEKEVQATVEGIGCKYKPEDIHLIK